jgi:lincosamide nucleotidyltransferase B/F
MKLPQLELIERVRAKCLRDGNLDAALTYGSFTRGEGDQYSDIEFWLFFADEKLGSVDQDGWIGDIAPIYWSVVNEYGTRVAFFKDHLIRGEFHFAAGSAMAQVGDWPAVEPARAARMVIVDRSGALREYLVAGRPLAPASAEEVERLCGRYLNWYLFGRNVLRRGDLAQAHVILGIAAGHLIWMARLAENSTRHWQAPSKGLEKEISAEAYKRFASTISRLDRASLDNAYRAAWAWSRDLMSMLENSYRFSIPPDLISAISGH